MSRHKHSWRESATTPLKEEVMTNDRDVSVQGESPSPNEGPFACLIRYRNLAIFTVVILLGCSRWNSETQPTEVAESGRVGHWITLTSKHDYLMKVGVRQVRLPANLDLPSIRTARFRVQPYGQVFGSIIVGGRELLLAQFETGSGVVNPILSMYAVSNNRASLIYVWSRPIPSIYGFTSIKTEARRLLLRADFPAEGAFRGHHSQAALPIPGG